MIKFDCLFAEKDPDGANYMLVEEETLFGVASATVITVND